MSVLFGVPLDQFPFALRVTVLFWIFIFGANIGSFLNVVIARVPEGLSVVSPRSRCPKCENGIAWYDNLPMISWLILRAKCRHCDLPISARYPFIELLIGLFALAIVARFGLTFTSLELFIFTTVAVAIAMIDLDTFLIPISLLITLFSTALFFGALGFFTDNATGPAWLIGAARATGMPGFVERLLGAGLGFGILALVIVIATPYFRARGRIGPDETAMGWGDPLLLGGIGMAVGWMAVPLVIMLSAIQGSIIGVLMIALAKKKAPPTNDMKTDDGEGEGENSVDDEWVPPESAIPFGPFLVLGALEVLFFGEMIFEKLRVIYGPLF